MNKEIIITSDGSHTIMDTTTNENYHSIYGALSESLYVFIEQGLKQITKYHVNIFEMGFGTGLNTFLTLLYSIEKKISINYITLELFPVSNSLIPYLNYPELCGAFNSRKYFEQIHYCDWDKEINIAPDFILKKINEDICTFKFDKLYDLVYYDAFSPNKQPELWSDKIFCNISRHISSNGILVTYSASGKVKRSLQNAGLQVEKIKGPVNKRHMLRAQKIA